MRHTFEQPAEAWAGDLRAAGFTGVAVEPLHGYWWAPAVLVSGTGAQEPGGPVSSSRGGI